MKLSVTILALLLVGCATAPKPEAATATATTGEGASYTAPEEESAYPGYESSPNSFSTKNRNGVRQDKNKLKKDRKKSLREPWVFVID